MIPLVIAAHGTRDSDGEAQSRALAELVADRLAPTPVSIGYVELNEPAVDDALTAALQAHTEPREAVVVPLMLGVGGHVREDIPEAMARAEKAAGPAHVVYGSPLGHDPRLARVVTERIDAAQGDWDRADTTVVLVGRGSSDVDANADHVRLARLLLEATGVAQVLPGFAQVARPSVPEALNQAYALGARHIVVAPNLLFSGKLRRWISEQAQAWVARHDDVELRLAEVIGPCTELADVVIERYHQAAESTSLLDGSPAYLAGLMLRDKKVVVVGAGRLADRRVPRLLAAGADVTLVSPTLSVRLQRLVTAGTVQWQAAPFADADVDDAWYVLACTNDPQVNAQVAEAARRRHTFCVRADDARQGSSWTPATEHIAGFSVGVLGNRSPALSARVRNAVVRELLT